jgi:hypothetical protein
MFPTAHVQAFGNPFEGHRGFSPQSRGVHAHFPRVAFALALQILVRSARLVQFGPHDPFRLFGHAFVLFLAIMMFTHFCRHLHQQFLPPFHLLSPAAS